MSGAGQSSPSSSAGPRSTAGGPAARDQRRPNRDEGCTDAAGPPPGHRDAGVATVPGGDAAAVEPGRHAVAGQDRQRLGADPLRPGPGPRADRPAPLVPPRPGRTDRTGWPARAAATRAVPRARTAPRCPRPRTSRAAGRAGRRVDRTVPPGRLRAARSARRSRPSPTQEHGPRQRGPADHEQPRRRRLRRRGVPHRRQERDGDQGASSPGHLHRATPGRRDRFRRAVSGPGRAPRGGTAAPGGAGSRPRLPGRPGG
jgi:hypothetical protein